jgi:hypothetical protein
MATPVVSSSAWAEMRLLLRFPTSRFHNANTPRLRIDRKEGTVPWRSIGWRGPGRQGPPPQAVGRDARQANRTSRMCRAGGRIERIERVRAAKRRGIERIDRMKRTNSIGRTHGKNGGIGKTRIRTNIPTAQTTGIGGTRIIQMWIPGAKFGKGGTGNVQYENASPNQLKFYDYRLCCVAYDWYGTAQDTNNVGFVNDRYAKLYFKDA